MGANECLNCANRARHVNSVPCLSPTHADKIRGMATKKPPVKKTTTKKAKPPASTKPSASPFLVWRPGRFGKGICVLAGIRGVADDWELREGISRMAGWPSDAGAKMSKKFPRDSGLADSMHCNHVVVSARVRQLLESEPVRSVEFLPLQIINHKDEVVATDYFVLNPLEIVDCIDLAASEGKENPLDPGTLYGVARLVLRDEAVPQTLSVFRTKHWTDVSLIRRELAERMTKAGLTGLYFIEPAEYQGLD